MEQKTWLDGFLDRLDEGPQDPWDKLQAIGMAVIVVAIALLMPVWVSTYNSVPQAVRDAQADLQYE